MKSSEQITPEQQIRNQSETIQSLERKIESLESELQKHLDPDKGELVYHFKPGQKHGEAALLQQIDDLQRQLDDCPDEGKIIHDAGLYDRLFNIVAGALMPPGNDEKDMTDNWELWFYFRQEILKSEQCTDFLSHKSFRDVITSMNHFISDMERHVKDRLFLFASTAENLLASPNPEGWGLALEALSVLERQTPPEGSESPLSQVDIQNLRLSIQIIRKCALFTDAADRDHEQKQK